ncbi:hypothetical protein [uncultured Sphingomonas sp.]|uniref:hypothetical protein n=1 Tax=uncultured Sphingomonas sp. TaxID=158754 RepID=UPI0035CA86D3
MVHLSVAIARFAEALFWSIAQAAGLALVGGLLGLAALVMAWRSICRVRSGARHHD